MGAMLGMLFVMWFLCSYAAPFLTSVGERPTLETGRRRKVTHIRDDWVDTYQHSLEYIDAGILPG